MLKTVIAGLLIPFIGTAAGSACVFFLKDDLKDGIKRALTGFAAGVMVAASIWSLIVPAIEQSSGKGRLAFLPAFIGFWAGILFLLLLDHVIPHLHASINQVEGPKSKLTRTAMLVLAVTLHNIPEGMAVGVVYAGLLNSSGKITAGAALALALGIAIQNFPEGAIISMPLYSEGKSKSKSFVEESVLPLSSTLISSRMFNPAHSARTRLTAPMLTTTAHERPSLSMKLCIRSRSPSARSERDWNRSV